MADDVYMMRLLCHHRVAVKSDTLLYYTINAVQLYAAVHAYMHACIHAFGEREMRESVRVLDGAQLVYIIPDLSNSFQFVNFFFIISCSMYKFLLALIHNVCLCMHD